MERILSFVLPRAGDRNESLWRLTRAGLVSSLAVAAPFAISQSIAASPSEGETVVIVDPDSDPVHGDEGVGEVSVEVRDSGSIVSQQAAILGRGPEWSLLNDGLLRRFGGFDLSGEGDEFLYRTVALRQGGHIETNPDGSVILDLSGDNLVIAREGSYIEAIAAYLGVDQRISDELMEVREFSGSVYSMGEIVTGVDYASIEFSGDANEFRRAGLGAESFAEVTNMGNIRSLVTGDIEVLGNDNFITTAGVLIGERVSGTSNALAGVGAELEAGGVVENQGEIVTRIIGDIHSSGDGNTVDVGGLSVDGELELENSYDIMALAETEYRDTGIGNVMTVAGVSAVEGNVHNEETAGIVSLVDGDIRLDGGQGAFLVRGLEFEEEGRLTNRGEIAALSVADIAIGGDGNYLGVSAVEVGTPVGKIENSDDLISVMVGEMNFSGSAGTVEAIGLYLGGDGEVENSGAIETILAGDLVDNGHQTGIDATGVLVSGDAVITNGPDGSILTSISLDGTLSGTTEIQAAAIEVDGILELNNQGTLVASVDEGLISHEESGSASVDLAGVYAEGGSSIENTGEISVRHDGVAGGAETNAAGILIEPGTNQEAAQSSLVNEGNITVSGDVDNLVGIGFLSGGTIENRGRITVRNPNADGVTAAVFVDNYDGGAAEVRNHGAIESIGGNAVTFTDGGLLMNRGSIDGDVYLGEGDAELAISPEAVITGNVDAGEGSNRLRLLDGAGEGVTVGHYDGAFANFSELHVNAEGVYWHLENEQTYEGGTRISDGNLVVLDSLISEVEILPGGSLAGGGSITGNVDVSGRLGGDGLEVDGDVFFRENSGYYVSVGHGALDATGRAIIEGGEATAEATLGVKPRTAYVVLHAGEGISGAFDEFHMEGFDFSPLLAAPEVEYGETTIELFLPADREAIRALGETRTEREISSALATWDPQRSEQNDAYNAFLLEGNEENFGYVADSLSGEVIESAALTSSRTGVAFRRAISGTLGSIVGPARGAAETSWRDLAETRYAGEPTVPAPEEQRSGGNFWTRGYGGNGDVKWDNDATDVDYRLSGIILGGDMVATETSQVGLAFGYGQNRVEREGTADRVEADVFHGALYGVHRYRDFLFDAALVYGRHDFESDRRTQPGNNRVTADYKGNEMAAAIGGSYLFEAGRGLFIQPQLGLDYTRFRQRDFEENGAFGLDVDRLTIDSLQASAGVRMALVPHMGSAGAAVPELRARYSRELMDREAAFSASFAGSPDSRFVTEGPRLDRDRWNLGGGVNFFPATLQRLTIYADYDATVTRNQVEHLFSGGFRVAF